MVTGFIENSKVFYDSCKFEHSSKIVLNDSGGSGYVKEYDIDKKRSVIIYISCNKIGYRLFYKNNNSVISHVSYEIDDELPVMYGRILIHLKKNYNDSN